MRRGPSNQDKKCVSPWTGLLVIVLVCAVLAAAIFLGSKKNTTQTKGMQARDMKQVDFIQPVTTPSQPETDRMLVF